LKIPIIGTAQENRQGRTAYSDSFTQDCEVLFQTTRGKNAEENDEVVIHTPALREAKLNGFAIHALPCTSFEEKYSVEEESEEAERQFENPAD
jgi:hypothetical protein